jgi:hypothetical protein
MDVKFEGAEASAHRIEAYTGAVSLEGIARAATLAAHYAATGEVRFRSPYSDEIEFQFAAPEAGSLDFPLDAIANIASAVSAKKLKLATALFLAILARASGQEVDGGSGIDLGEISSGDLDALAEAATPGLERAHRWIDLSSKKIVVGSSKRHVTLDTRSKTYLENEIQGGHQRQDVTVASLNGNNKTGRVYFDDLGRTIPFKVAREAKGRTTVNLSRYLTRYLNKTNEWVNIEYMPFFYSDGRLKRILIFDCEPASDND